MAMRGLGWTVFAALAVTSAAEARDKRPDLFTAVVACRTETSEANRLACYDRSVSAIDDAEKTQQLVVIDREQIKKAKRSLFGITLPSLNVFGSGNDQVDSVIEAQIARAGQSPDGNWIIVLDDGAKWLQTDFRNLPNGAKAGQTIRIRRAAMGSYLANVNKQIAIRMKRVTD